MYVLGALEFERPFLGPPYRKISEKGPFVCVLHIAIPPPPGRAEQALSMRGQPTPSRTLAEG